MPNPTPSSIARGLRKKLESLEGSGVEHVFTTKPKAKAPVRGRDGSPSRPNVETGKGGRFGETSLPAPAMQARSSSPPKPTGKPVIVPSKGAEALREYAGERAKKLVPIAEQVAKCAQCGLCSTRTQTVFSRGNPNSPLMLIGEAPGADEDAQGFPFVGRAGKLLDDIIVKGMKYQRDDVYVCNVLKCRPPGNRNPEPDEIEACKPYLQTQIEIIQPAMILALGRFPAQWLLDSTLPIGRLRGKIWDVNGRKVVATYHPAYLLRNPSAKVDVWKDVQLVMEFFGKDKPLAMRG